MNKKDLFDYNEEDLPDVTLSKKQKASIKASLFNNIKRFSERNSELPIDNSLKNIKAIEKELGHLADDTIHGVRHARVLKELALQAIHKDCPLNESDILYENFFHIGYGMESQFATVSFFYASFYCYIFVTKDYLVTYSFDNYYRLQHKHYIHLKDIKYVKISNRDCDGMKLTNDNLIISLDHKCRDNISNIYLVNSSTKNDIEEAKNLFVSLGVNESKIPFKYSLNYYLYFLVCIFFAVILLARIFGY